MRLVCDTELSEQEFKEHVDEGLVYLNGELVPESKAKVSVFDRGFNGGEGVYEVTRRLRMASCYGN